MASGSFPRTKYHGGRAIADTASRRKRLRYRQSSERCIRSDASLPRRCYPGRRKKYLYASRGPGGSESSYRRELPLQSDPSAPGSRADEGSATEHYYRKGISFVVLRSEEHTSEL